MNVTIAAPHRTPKKTFIRLAHHPQTARLTGRAVEGERRQCESIFLVSCLGGVATEHSEEHEILQLHKLESEERKARISLSLSHKNTQLQTPRRAEQLKQEPAAKMTNRLPPHPHSALRLKTNDSSKIKLTLTPLPSSENRNREPSSCEEKQSITRISIDHAIEEHSRQADQSVPPTPKLTTSIMSAPKVQQLLPQTKIVQYIQQPPVSTAEHRHIVIDRAEPEQVEHEEEEHEPINWKEKLRHRRGIGEYAKTIKSYNGSEPKDADSSFESISIVIDRAIRLPHERPMVTPLTRGSIKVCPGEETLKRAYGSMGEELDRAHLGYSREEVDLIEEDLYDSDI